jgi:hypothetical protein
LLSKKVSDVNARLSIMETVDISCLRIIKIIKKSNKEYIIQRLSLKLEAIIAL